MNQSSLWHMYFKCMPWEWYIQHCFLCYRLVFIVHASFIRLKVTQHIITKCSNVIKTMKTLNTFIFVCWANIKVDLFAFFFWRRNQHEMKTWRSNSVSNISNFSYIHEILSLICFAMFLIHHITLISVSTVDYWLLRSYQYFKSNISGPLESFYSCLLIWVVKSAS